MPIQRSVEKIVDKVTEQAIEKYTQAPYYLKRETIIELTYEFLLHLDSAHLVLAPRAPSMAMSRAGRKLLRADPRAWAEVVWATMLTAAEAEGGDWVAAE